jgi:hypothetical protein
VVEGALVGGIETGDAFRDFVFGVGDGPEYAFSKILRFVAVAKFPGLVLAGGSARRDGGAAKRSAIEEDVGFDSGIAAGINDLAGVNVGDSRRHFG